MSDLFLKIINMSISASWLVLAVLLLRIVLKKAPKWVNVLLWGIVAVRLAFPFSIESALSLIPSAETISPGIMMDTVPSVQTGVPAINNVINPVIGSSLAPAPGASANPLQIWIPILSIVWAVGVAALLLYTAVSYWRLRRKVSEAVILRDNIYQSENVASPFVLGVFRPRIYLPYNMDGQDLSHVVSHEQAHIRRRDHWWKPLGFLLLTIHWFNPLMWLAYVLLCRDIELACDEKVIKELDNEQRADYAQALVVCSVNRRMIAACPLAFGEVGVKDRVKSVMNYKKPAFWIIILAVIACVIVAVCFLTNPMGFQFDEATHTIVSANHFDMRNADDAVAIEMNPAQISELSSRLARVKNTKKSDEYGGFTPGYQISALLKDGTYIRINGYSLSDNDMVDIEWNEERYVVSDEEFQDYLSRICAGGDVSSADNAVAGTTYLYEGEGFIGNFTITLYNDGTFTYYEGMASSYIGIGSWEQNGDSIILTDDGHGGYGLVNHFQCDGNDLVFVEQDSNNFVYVKVKDGERFHSTGEAFKLNDTAAAVTKWFDYLETPDEMKWDGRLEINLPEFPDVTFRWYPEKIEAVTSDGITPLYTGMPIWNAYFCDLTGDGLPELCSTISWGSGMIDNRIIVYDYANGASYTLADRGNYDYTLWLNDNDGQLYADKKLYNSEEKVSTGRLRIANGFLKIDEQKATADPLDAAISSAILDHYASSQPDGLIHVESHVLLANEGMSGTPLFDSDNHMEKITAYLLVLQQKYSTYGGKLVEVGGSYVPAAITFAISGSGEYILEEYWEPRDGGHYVDDVRDKFPGSSADDALNDQAYIEDLEAQNYSKALAYMNSAGSLDTRIAELLDEICASPGTFASELEKYLEAHESEYQELLGYGEFTLHYCFDQFLMGNQTDLREYIMARACEDISLSWGEAILIDGPAPTTGQAWFDAFCSNAESLAGQLSEEELEKHYPATWLFLQLIGKSSVTIDAQN